MPYRMKKRKYKDMSGMRYGRMIVINLSHVSKAGDAYWICECDCGTTKTVKGQSLRSGSIVSCGCYHRDILSIPEHGHAVNGKCSPTYTTWTSMISRCKNKRNPAYQNYGGRGIAVCERWLESFENFLEDMGVRPDGMSLDRRDNNGNYDRENCKWSTKKEQQNNRRDTVILTHNGESLPLEYWVARIGIKSGTLRSRIRNGLATSEALTIKTQRRSA